MGSTVKVKATTVVRDTEPFQRLLDLAARSSIEEGIRQGREDIAQGRTAPARAALKSFRREHGI